MSRSEIYVVNTTVGTSLANGATYVPVSVVRRYGQNVQLAGNGVTLSGAGYYDIDAVATVTATAVGTVTATIYMDGNPLVGSTSTQQATAIGDVVALPLTAVARLNCNCSESVITVVISGQATTSNNLALRVRKE